MRVWHVDTIGSPSSVDGVATGLWLLAREQARQGSEVTLFLRRPGDDEGLEIARRHAITLRPASRSLLERRWADPGALRPDLVHMHSGWIPAHAALGRRLRRQGIPYVLTPHGAYGPAVRASKRLPREAYVKLVERPHVRAAAGLLYNLDDEAPEVRLLAGGRHAMGATVPFPIDTSHPVAGWSPDRSGPVVFLGRWEPHQKGLDRLVAVARLLPEVRFALYGSPPEQGSATLPDLRRSAPSNVTFNPPVHGRDKDEVLRRARLYLQYSRFEGFPLSVADALLADVAAQRRLSDNGMSFARARFDPAMSAQAHLDFYSRALGARQGGRS